MSICDAKTPINQVSNRHYSKDNNENGSVIVWIFIMIALLSALYYTFSNGFRSGEAQLSKEKLDLAATEILDYAQSIKQAVHTLQINGCDETEISFENNSSSSSYINLNSPTDKSCHVFDPNGGGAIYSPPASEWLDNAFNIPLYVGNYKTWYFNTSPQIEGVGTNESELRIAINFLKKDLCMAINDKLGIDNPSNAPPIDLNSSGSGQFTGTYGSPFADNIGDDGGHNLPGKLSFCRQGNLSIYQFNQVLIAR